MADNSELEKALEKKIQEQSKSIAGSVDLDISDDKIGIKNTVNRDLNLKFGNEYSNFISYDEILHWARPISADVISKFKENVLFKDELINESNAKKDNSSIPPHLVEIEQEKDKFFNDLDSLKIELGIDIIEQEEIARQEEENKEFDFEDEDFNW